MKRGFKILREEGVREFGKKLLEYLGYQIRILLFPYALLRIKSLSQDCYLQEAVDLAFNGLWGLIKPSQVQDEILDLLENLKGKRPKIVLEIGTATGGTLFLLSHVASEDATIISVDLPQGAFGGGYLAWKIPLYKAFASNKQKMHLIRANSHSNATLDKVKILINGRFVDFLFIDGDHSYYGVKKDFEMYSSLVRQGGIIAFHDIVPGPQENVGGVPEFWRRVKDNYESEEIVKDWSQNGYGIGVIYA